MRTTLIKLNTFLFVALYIGAGINHFWHPVTYVAIVPPYFPYRSFLVQLSGVIEIVLALLFLIKQYRKLATILIILMLIVYITLHVYMIQMHGCVTPTVCIPEWLAWVRLFPLQFILIWWAWKSYEWLNLLK